MVNKRFRHSSGLSVLHNYFDPTKLFSNLYLIKFSDTPANLFFCAVRF